MTLGKQHDLIGNNKLRSNRESVQTGMKPVQSGSERPYSGTEKTG